MINHLILWYRKKLCYGYLNYKSSDKPLNQDEWDIQTETETETQKACPKYKKDKDIKDEHLNKIKLQFLWSGFI